MGALWLQQIFKQYDDWELQVDLEVSDGEIMTLLGPSGCGKTTTLRLIAGFIRADRGHVHVGGDCLDHVPPFRRNIGVVFQDYALFPHMDVFKNIAFGMRMKKRHSPQAMRQRVEELLALVGLEGYEHRYPEHLSGGEQQRIALLRAIAPQPTMLLLDEPLSALDFQLRKRLRQEIRNIQQRFGITTIYVTHDQEEAMSISDRITVMNNGRVQQIGAPVEIYQRPKTAFVAQFVGISNVLSGEIVTKDATRMVVQTAHHALTIPAEAEAAPRDAVTCFFRPEDTFLSLEPVEMNALRGVIVGHEYLGAEILITVETAGKQPILVSNYIKNETLIPHEGAEVWVNIPVSACQLVAGGA